MSSRHRPKVKPRSMPNVVRLVHELAMRPDHKERLACSYGVHDFVEDQPEWGYKQCARPHCKAVYSLPKLWQGLGSEMNPYQHCTATGCYTMSHTAAWCGKPQPRQCDCHWCYPERGQR